MGNETALQKALRRELLAYLQPFWAFEGLEGIVVLGGCSTNGARGLDRFSDLDAALFVSISEARTYGGTLRNFLDSQQSALPEWLPPFSTWIACEDHPDKRIEVNVHQLIVEFEAHHSLVWDEGKKEAYSRAEILYDPNGCVSEIIRRQLAWDDDAARRELLRVLGQAFWHGVVNPQRQLARGLVINALDLLNEAVELLVHALYLVNREYRPHKKWRLSHCKSLLLLPPGDWDALIARALISTGNSDESVVERTVAIERLLGDVTMLARSIYDLPDDIYTASTMESYTDRQLRRGVRSSPSAEGEHG